MSFAGTPIEIALVAAIVLMLGYAAYILLSPSVHRPPLGAAILFLGAWWVLCQLMECDSAGSLQKILWNKLQYVSMAGLPVAWLGFCVQHTGHRELATVRNTLLVSLLPAVLLVLAFTNELHGLMWRVLSVPSGRAAFVDKRFGPGFYVLAVFMYVGIGAGAALLAQMFTKSRYFYRRQARFLLVGAALPLLAGIIDLSGIDPLGGFDLTPLVLSAISLVVVAYGFARLKFRDTVPLAFESAIESLRETVLVLDLENRIIYVNREGSELFSGAPVPYVGKNLAQLCPALLPVVSDAHGSTGRGELVLGDKVYDVTVSPLSDWQERVVCNITVLREITHLKAAQARLLQMNEELEAKVQERTRALSQSNRALQEEVIERQKAEEVIQASLKEKEVLLKEIHHRVKNNLQVVSSLLRLPAVSDPYAANVLEETYNRIRSIAEVHEILYKSNDLSKLRASSYIQSLLRHLEGSYAGSAKYVTVSCDVEEVSMSVDTGISCGLLINELVSNSFRHAFPEGRKGTIRVRLRARGDKATLSVSDDGIGIPEGVDMLSPQTLGLKIVTTLTRQVRGEMELKRDNGTEFILTFHLGQ